MVMTRLEFRAPSSQQVLSPVGTRRQLLENRRADERTPQWPGRPLPVDRGAGVQECAFFQAQCLAGRSHIYEHCVGGEHARNRSLVGRFATWIREYPRQRRSADTSGTRSTRTTASPADVSTRIWSQ